MKKPSKKRAKKPARPKTLQARVVGVAHTTTRPCRSVAPARIGAADASFGLSRWARIYEGVMGTQPKPIERPSAGAFTTEASNEWTTLALLSVPVFAMIFGLSITHTLKSRRIVTANAASSVGAGSNRLATSLKPSVPREILTSLPTAQQVAAVAPDLLAATALRATATASSFVIALPNQLSPPLEDVMVQPPVGTQRLAILRPRDVMDEPFVAQPHGVIARDSPGDVTAQDDRQSCVAPSSFWPAPLSLNASTSLTSASFGLALAASARAQTREFVIYNDTYRSLAYPNGDVQPLYGVCTDVVIRAYRGLGIDLQQLVHESRIGNGDVSIDHRRTETLRRFFARFGEPLPVTTVAEDYQPGDIVTYDRPQNRHSRAHIALVSDVVAPSGRYMIVHNRGWGPQLEDGLFVDAITGHYRYRGPPNAPHPSLAAATMPSRLPPTKQARLSVVRQGAVGTRPTVLARIAQARWGSLRVQTPIEGTIMKGLGH